jgi:hypothetical protein
MRVEVVHLVVGQRYFEGTLIHPVPTEPDEYASDLQRENERVPSHIEGLDI